MALWGNQDNVGSAGTVSLDYDTGVVTGSGTTFGSGSAGAAHTEPHVGDVIRFGERDGTYFGDAVIISIASTQQCTIGSTMGLSGAAIAGVEYQVSTLPKSTVLDRSYSESSFVNKEAPSFKTLITTHVEASGGVAAGSSILSTFAADLIPPNGPLVVGDLFKDGSSKNIPILGFGTATIAADNISPVGFLTVFFDTTLTPAIGAEFSSGSFGIENYDLGKVVSTSSTSVTFTNALVEEVGIGSVLLLSDAYFVSLGSTIENALSQGDPISFGRFSSGYDKYTYGVSDANAAAAQGSQFAVAHSGWVGVQTHIDNHGNLRVKGEVLVAASGITTGNVPIYDTDPTS